MIAKTAPLHDRASAGLRLFQALKLLTETGKVDFLATWHTVMHRFKERPVSYLVRDGVFSQKNMKFLDDQYFADLRAIGVQPVTTPGPVPFTVRPTNDFDIRPYLLNKRYDVIWLEYFYQADQYIGLIRQLQPWAHVIVDSVDLHFLRLERQCRYLENRVKYSVNAEQEIKPLDDAFPAKLQDHRNYAAHVKEHELRAYAKCDSIVVASEDDEIELKALLPQAETIMLPNLFDTPAGPPPPWAGRSGVVFAGNFDHGPNSSSAIFLKHEIAPALASRIGPSPITVLGNNPPYLIRNMEKFGACADQFKVTGHVRSTRPYLDRAMVSVAPILFGSGMSGKIGEALASGLPVVTTRLGALGLQLDHEKNCLIAETGEEFAEQIARLHRDQGLWDRLSRNGRAHLEENFSRNTVAARLRDALAKATDGPRLARSLPKAAKAQDPFLRAPKFAVPKKPQISVIVLCHNQWAYTELCLRSLAHAQSLEKNLSVEYILVDNASTDATAAAAKKIPGLRVIENPKNVGFAAGNNVGIRAARGENIVLLNNDTLVSPFWLSRLHAHAMRVGRAGIIGPATNTEPGQALFPTRYNGVNDFFRYNRDIARSNAGQWELCDKISGLCMYLPREIIEKVGLLSESYGMGYFEDDDYCFRVRDAGYRTVWAKDVYVHHFGSISFEHSGVSREKHLNYGMSQFIFTWGKRALKHIAKSHHHTLIKPAELQVY
ncbi:MAG: glycosyltransferase, partial [Bdellovibrionota bacterium]